MCVTFNTERSGNCTCKFAHACRRRLMLEAAEKNLSVTLIKTPALYSQALPAIFSKVFANRSIHEKEGYHI
ncbi:MAG TPA: hypothetical protein VNS32_23085 [Flavisolibacter sp.]|nr:hypothetical protein [Flavisolibacter sp.]